jgi:opacity protein-like surface antigen
MIRTALLAGLAASLAVTTLAAAATSTTTAAAAPAVTVGTDALGDWGGGGDAAAVGHALGQDLLSASIGMSSPETVDFVLGVSFLPSAGGVPEASRYTWNFDVNKKPFELDGKFTNYSRGACDPTSGQCPPPRDPGPAPFLLRGDCAAGEGSAGWPPTSTPPPAPSRSRYRPPCSASRRAAASPGARTCSAAR